MKPWSRPRVCLVCGLEHARQEAITTGCEACIRLHTVPSCLGYSAAGNTTPRSCPHGRLGDVDGTVYLCRMCGSSAPPLGFDKGVRVIVNGRRAAIESVRIHAHPFSVGVYIRYDDGVLDLVSHHYVVLEEDAEEMKP